MVVMVMAQEEMKCRFCGEMVNKSDLIFGVKKNINICHKCVDVCNHIIEDMETKEEKKEYNILTPIELKDKLDEYIIGQERAKKILSVAVYNHYKRVFHLKDSNVAKANICMVGESGSGKTLMVTTIAKLLDVPIVIADANSLTSSGYVGRDVEDILDSLIKKADGDIERAQHGIVFIDEIDKIAGVEGRNTKDIGGEGVQQALLKMIEGANIMIPKKKYDFESDELQTIDTTNILFIVSGAFSGMDKIVAKRLEKHTIGFGAEHVGVIKDDNILNRITQEDLITYGMIPEFVGRLQTIAVLHKLDEEAMVRILEEPKDALIRQYKDLLAVDGVQLEIDKPAIRKIAKIAIKRKTGARSLRSIMENTMLDIMYNAPTNKPKRIVVHEEDIKADFA